MKKELSIIQQNIGYSFQQIELLQEALTHTSYSNECRKTKKIHNERLEFLGDSILSFIITEHLFQEKKGVPEGILTKMRASIVCENSLKEVAEDIGLGKCMFLGRGEMASGGRNRPSILADATEALIAAIYLDGGIEKAKIFVLDKMKKIIEESANGAFIKDYKTRLQEELQKNKNASIVYHLDQESGPDHNKTFKISVSSEEKIIGYGIGKSKKEAEQQAAKNALEKLKHE